MPRNTFKGGSRPDLNRGMPNRFRCKVGGEWKNLEEFSQNQQRLVQRGGTVDAAHSGMTCREHTNKTRLELRCELCNLIKPRDAFSKNSLKNEDYKCKRCMAWTETQEPSVTPVALETGHISVEEQESNIWGDGKHIDTFDFFDEADSIAEPILSRMETLSMSDMSDCIFDGRSGKARYRVDTASVSGETDISTSTLPPHLVERVQTSRSGAKSVSNTSSAYVSEKENLRSQASLSIPPHLRMSSASGEEFSSTRSVSTATTVQEAKKSRQIPFNAWDPAGKRHKDFKEPTEGSSLSSAASITSASTANSANNGPNVIGNWDDVQPESELEFETRGKKGWPKAKTFRIPESELKKQPVLTHVKTRHPNPDIDRQRRMAYCDSDDSDYA